MSHLSPSRSRLVLSESLGRQNPSSPYRRPPSLVLQGRQPSLLQQTRSGSVSVMPFNQETSELLETARSDIVRLRQRQDRKVYPYFDRTLELYWNVLEPLPHCLSNTFGTWSVCVEAYMSPAILCISVYT